MKDSFKIVMSIAIFFVIIWGIFALFQGKGFFEPTLQFIDALGDFVSSIIKVAFFVALIWFVLNLKKK